MSWSDWEYVWKRQRLPVGKHADIALLIETYESKRRKTEKALFARDFAEAGAGIFLLIVMPRGAVRMQHHAWMLWITIAIVFAVTVFFLFERIRVRRRRVPANASMFTKVEADLAELRHQRWLIWNVGWWYFGPLGVGVALGFTAGNLNRPVHALQRDPIFIFCYAVFGVVLFIGAWLMNRRAVCKRLDPRIQELEKLRQHLISN